jgi:hypothetical protein
LHSTPLCREKQRGLAELPAKLSGLLIDRIQEVPQIDLRGTLEAARQRVFDITPHHGTESVSAVQMLTAAPVPYKPGPVLDD